MIINIRGTGGSGKSTLVRTIMDSYESREGVFVEGRRRPIGYLLQRSKGNHPLWVVGHYETACGGGDTISKPSEVFSSAEEYAGRNCDVLFEGIISQDDTTRTVELHRKFPGQLVVLFLTTPLSDCLVGIQSRRDERGDDRPLNPKNTANRVNGLVKRGAKLKDAGVSVLRVSRDEALAFCREKLLWAE